MPFKQILAKFDFETTWLRHAEWLLGEDVLGYTVEDKQSGVCICLPWAQFLELEYQVRRKAMTLMNTSGLSLVDALAAAKKHEGTVQRYLYIPLGIHAGQQRGAKRASEPDYRSQPLSSSQPPPQLALYDAPRGGDKGGAKGGAKGDKKGDRHPPSWKTGQTTLAPDSTKKCGKYQRDKCRDAKCRFAHLCQVCNEVHPMVRCPRRPNNAQPGKKA